MRPAGPPLPLAAMSRVAHRAGPATPWSGAGSSQEGVQTTEGGGGDLVSIRGAVYF